MTAHLAALSKEIGFTLVIISTGTVTPAILFFKSGFARFNYNPSLSIDYVFDGTSPPYVPSAEPNPLNLYAITKRDAELAVLGVEGAHVAVLRVPVLCALLSRPSW